MNGLPLVSIIIPAYNAATYLPDAVHSAQSQVHDRIEIIIVDDGSTDATADVAAELAARDSRIHVITKANGGLSSARNAGIREAKGEFISFLDSDDTIHPMKLRRQVSVLDSSVAGLAFCDYYTADADLVPLAISKTLPALDDIGELLPLRNVFPAHAALVRREVVRKVGSFDETLKSAEDWDYWIRCAQVTEMVYVPGALCSYRRHSDQMHNDRQRMRSSQLRVVHKHYPPKSLGRRMAMAGLHWGEAKYQYGQHHFARMAIHVLLTMALSRTPAAARRVVRLGSYG